MAMGKLTMGGAPVVESGESSLGSWTKFADGTMICYKANAIIFNPMGLSETQTKTWNMPQSFVNTNYVIQHSLMGSYSGGWGVNASILMNSLIVRLKKENSVNLATHSYTYAISNNIPFDLMAIGRWK